MLKVFLQTLLGLSSLFSGLYLTFNYIQNIVDGVSIWLLLISLPLIGFGSFLLLRAGKSEATVVKRVKIAPLNPHENQSAENKEGFASKLEKNKALSDQFGKTNEARNRLKMLEISAEAQK